MLNEVYLTRRRYGAAVAQHRGAAHRGAAHPLGAGEARRVILTGDVSPGGAQLSSFIDIFELLLRKYSKFAQLLEFV